MFKVLKSGHVYAPLDMGIKDVLLANDTIALIADKIDPVPGYGATEVYDVKGCFVVPGFIDQHVHLIGGGGEGGFSTRTPEVMLSELTTAGITTVVGTLGTDSVTRHMESLLAKARGLEEEGISAWIYTGAYNVPVPTITGSVRSDLILIDKVIGVGEVAMSDHRSSQPSQEDFAQLAAEARVGGMLAGKAGVLHIHMGNGKGKLDWVFAILAQTDLPITQFTPTHLNKNKELLMEGIRFAKAGGMLDITTSSATVSPGRVQPPEAIRLCVEAEVPPDRITMSSDGNGSLPVFNEKGELTGLMAASPRSLYQAVRNIVEAGILPLEAAIKFVTVNPAKSLKLRRKGRVSKGYDADIVVLDKNLNIRHVFAKGRCMVREQQAVVKGVFEK
ncbi:MAG: beta-aspartyl-peptidase [Veillonellales bacterium]